MPEEALSERKGPARSQLTRRTAEKTLCWDESRFREPVIQDPDAREDDEACCRTRHQVLRGKNQRDVDDGRDVDVKVEKAKGDDFVRGTHVLLHGKGLECPSAPTKRRILIDADGPASCTTRRPCELAEDVSLLWHERELVPFDASHERGFGVEAGIIHAVPGNGVHEVGVEEVGGRRLETVLAAHADRERERERGVLRDGDRFGEGQFPHRLRVVVGHDAGAVRAEALEGTVSVVVVGHAGHHVVDLADPLGSRVVAAGEGEVHLRHDDVAADCQSVHGDDVVAARRDRAGGGIGAEVQGQHRAHLVQDVVASVDVERGTVGVCVFRGVAGIGLGRIGVDRVRLARVLSRVGLARGVLEIVSGGVVGLGLGGGAAAGDGGEDESGEGDEGTHGNS